MKLCLPIILALLLSNSLSAQKIDSITNIPKYKILGNCWSFGASYNLSKTNEYGISIGRTLKTLTSYRTAQEYKMRFTSWGLGYAYYKKKNMEGQLVSAFGEFSNFYWPPFTARLEYMYDVSHNSHYIRPYIGLYLYTFEIMYDYSFILNKQANAFNHGITFKIKILTKGKDWQNVYENQYYKKEKQKFKK